MDKEARNIFEITYGFYVYHEIKCDYKGNCIDCPHTLNQRWIPVSEKFPEEIRTRGYGLCTVMVTHKCAGITRTSLGVFDKGKFYTNNNFKHNDTSVIAWMPLPEPYKEDEADDE